MVDELAYLVKYFLVSISFNNRINHQNNHQKFLGNKSKALFRTMFIVFFFSVFLLLTAKPSSAVLTCSVRANSCNVGETCIYAMSSSSNAHSELCSVGIYTQKVCCMDTGGATLTTSSGTKVLALSDTTNAHAEIGTLFTYAYNVYLGVSGSNIIECSYKTACDVGEACLGSLSAETNAHSGDCNAYSLKECCKIVAVTKPIVTDVTIIPGPPIPVSTSTNLFGYGTYSYTSPENASKFKWWLNNKPIVEDDNVNFLAHFDKSSLNSVRGENVQSPNSLLGYISPALFAPGKIDSGIFVGNSTNKLFNPSFENPYTTFFNSGIYGWLHTAVGSASGGFEANNFFIGKKSLKITDPGSPDGITIYQCTPAAPSATYTISAYVYSTTLGAVTIGMFDNTGTTGTIKTNNAFCNVYPSTINQWQRINVTCTTSATTDHICAAIVAQGATSGTAFVDGIQLEKGTLHPYGDQKISEFDTQNIDLGQNIVPSASFEETTSGWDTSSRTACV